MQKFTDIKLKLDDDISFLKEFAAKKMGVKTSALKHFKILKKSVDARNKSDIRIVYSVEADTAVQPAKPVEYPSVNASERPVIAGFGPSGMFAALVLSMAGLKPIVLERGGDADSRKEKVERFWKFGILDTESNVQFGEGGAGTFSDGKLTTLIGDPLCNEVLQIFYEAGAPEEILYLSKPHLGTDKLIDIVKNIRKRILNLGGEIHFNTKLQDFEMQNGKIMSVSADKKYLTDRLILATGHSGRDIYKLLYEKNVKLSQKAFSVGFRIEHLQSMVDASQYGEFAGHKNLPPAEYKLSYHGEKSAYTFCMCPGGSVVASSSEEGTVVTNGMSNFSRSGKNANSALLVGVTPADFGDGILDGMNYQHKFEKLAFVLGGENYHAPMQLTGDFIKNTLSKNFGKVAPTYSPGTKFCRLDKIFPEDITDTLKSAISDMDRRLKGFSSADSILTGVETRTSSPLRVDRDSNFSSLSVKGLYPCGEGCGYAGGIMSAAVDGIKVARQILEELK